MKRAAKKYFDKFKGQIETFISRENILMKERQKAAKNTAVNTLNSIVIGTILTILFAVIIALLITKSIIFQFKSIFQGLKSFRTAELKGVGKQFGEIINGLTSGSDNVAISSKEMANGANVQAASIEEISSASQEQARGIEQTSTAITDMDKIVQSNASGTEDLSAQSEELNNMVNSLLSIVEGNQSMKNIMTSEQSQFKHTVSKTSGILIEMCDYNDRDLLYL